MTTKTAEPAASQGENGRFPPSHAGPPEHQRSRTRNTVFKKGPLFISSKGIGWASWKKRWFILTRTSLVFFRSDPTAIPQKRGEVNLTLGGIDLNNSGSVEVKPDKKLLTVSFPDGRDGRAFTLKAETLEDLYEWKTALESALEQAPSPTAAGAQNGILKNEQADAVNGSAGQQKDRLPVKSMVIGRPILLALEDIDGSPSFLEKALRFIEDHGVKVEGILRQAADVDEVERRVREYEQGKTEFLPGEDAHVVADCVKHVLRELPSSPVPASCCNALLEAFRSDRGNRVNAMRTAILETFPEPNRRLLQRILRMMQNVASHKADNRMSTSGVAACMAPLLLRPLLAGDCEVENHHFDVAGDGSFQLLQAAAAANHAQAIIITLLDEYENIFREAPPPDMFSDSEESGSGTEATDDDYLYDDDDNEYGTEDHEDETDDDYEQSQSERSSIVSKSPIGDDQHGSARSSPSSRSSTPRHKSRLAGSRAVTPGDCSPVAEVEGSLEATGDIQEELSMLDESGARGPKICKKSASSFYGSAEGKRRPRWGRTPGQKNLSVESIDLSLDDEEEIVRLEAAKNELQNQIAEEAKGNALLQANMEKRKKALLERRLALEKDVARLEEQLQKEKNLRAALEAGLGLGHRPVSASIDEKTKADLQENAAAEEGLHSLKQRFDDLGMQFNQLYEHNYSHQHDKHIQLHEVSSKETIQTNKQREGESSMTNKQKDSESSRINKQKDNDTKVTATLYSERSIKSKEQPSHRADGGDVDNERRYEISSFPSKNQSHPSDAAIGSSSRPGAVPVNLPAVDAPAPKPSSSSNSRKNSKGEGNNSTTSALSKLTTRLNFLKERRNQIASELQNLEKNKEPVPSPKNTEKARGSESHQPVQSADRNQGSETQNTSGSQLLQDKTLATERSGSQSNQDSSSKKGSSPKSHNLLPHQNSDRGRKPNANKLNALMD
ncbi:Rho GTPase-activating protein REN1-like protein [Drosera capensis]